MGKTNGLVGGVTGKIGNVIGYYRRGKYLARAYNPHTTNVRSRLQQRQRARWITLMELLRPAIQTLRVGFHYDTPGYELPNAMKANMPFVTNSNPIDTEISFAEIQLSEGKFDGFAQAAGVENEGTTVTIDVIKKEGWENSLPADYGTGANAKLMLAAYDTNGKKWAQAEVGYNEVTNTVTMTVPNTFLGARCHFYGFLACPPDRVLGDGIPDYCSKTLYLGSATLE